MGNIFSYFFNEKTNYDYDDSLLQPLNNNNDIDIDNQIQYASIIDLESINSQVGILEQTTQNSLRNISKDVKYLFEEVKEIKEYLVRTNPSLTFDNVTESYVNCNDNTYNVNDNNNFLNNVLNNVNDNYSIYVDTESSIFEKQNSNVNSNSNISNSQKNIRSVSFNEKLQVSYLNNGTENTNDFFEDN